MSDMAMLLDAYTASGAALAERPAVAVVLGRDRPGSSSADIAERNASGMDGSEATPDLKPGDAVVALMDAAVCATSSCRAGGRAGPRAPALFMGGTPDGMEKGALALCRAPMPGIGTPKPWGRPG